MASGTGWDFTSGVNNYDVNVLLFCIKVFGYQSNGENTDVSMFSFSVPFPPLPVAAFPAFPVATVLLCVTKLLFNHCKAA